MMCWMARLLSFFLYALVLTAQWPQFRGPAGSGVSDSVKLPIEFGPDKNLLWKAEVPPGHSSPIISGNHIFITAAEGGKREQRGPRVIDDAKLVTIALDRRTGKTLWRREAPRPRSEIYQPTNSPASPSPVTDGKTVYVFFGDFGVLAYDFNGNERWKLPLGPFNNPNGHGSSPVIVDDLLILLCDDDTASYLLAVEKETGKVKWKTDRPEVTRSYSTPGVVRPRRGPVELIIPGSYRLDSYNAKTGEKLWWIGGMSWQPKSIPLVDGDVIYAHWWENGGEAEQPTETPSFVDTLAKFDSDKDGKVSRDEFASDPRLQRGFVDLDLAGDGFVDERDWSYYIARRSSRNALLAVRTGKRGDLTGSSDILWRIQKFLPNTPAPLLYRGVMYLIKDGGILTTLNPKTGEILKQGRLTGALDTYYASPVAGAGHVYVTSNPGKITVLKAGAEWEIVATNDLADICFATPAIADNKLYVRTRNTLYAFGTD
jgi:outer membrane protein assembly factor BamB